MKKVFILSFAAILACTSCRKSGSYSTGIVNTQAEPAISVLLARYMGETMRDGIAKIAIVRNIENSSSLRLVLESCIAEGRSMGFTVDTFMTDGDNKRCEELLIRLGSADYDGLIILNGEQDALKAPAEAGLKIVAFDSLQNNNTVVPGITNTRRDYPMLVRISLEKLVSAVHNTGQPPQKPVRIIRIDSGIPGLEEGQRVFDSFVRNGIIEEAACLKPVSAAFARSSIRERLAVMLTRFEPGTVDAVWAPNEDTALGSIDALTVAGRTDIKLASITVSDAVIRLMTNNSSIWIAAASVDPGIVGIVNMRLLAAKLAGEDVPAKYTFEGCILESSFLHNTVSMANIASVIPGWNQEQGLFDSYPWMAKLKTAEGKFLRVTSTDRL